MKNDTVPAGQIRLDEMRANATTPEEIAQVDQQQAAFNAEREAAIKDMSEGLGRLTLDDHNVVHDAAMVEESIARGEEMARNTAGRQA